MDDGPPDHERELTRCEVRGGIRFVHAAGALIRESTRALGFSEAAADEFRAVSEAFCRDVARRGFDDPETAAFDVTLVERPGEVLVRIDDRGLPRDFQSVRGTHTETLDGMLRRGFADGLRLLNLGRGGNRAELFKKLAVRDVREELPIEEHHERAAATAVAADAPTHIRFMQSSEALQLSRCVYRSYGYSYDADWVYHPEQIADRIDRGLLRSCIGVSDQGEIVGHLGLTLADPKAKVGEAGQAVVDPRYRGHHLFTSLKRAMADWASENGMFGMFSEATAAHPYSQKANLALGAVETGLLLGYIPASVGYRAIEKAAPEKRQSVTLFYLKTNDGPKRAAYAPKQHHPIVAKVLDLGGLSATLTEWTGDIDLAPATALDMSIRRDHNHALITVQAFGPDFLESIEDTLRNLCLHHLDCIYLDLPLANPATERLGSGVAKLGFFFGGIFPNLRIDGDVLRLQYLNNVDIQPTDVVVASDFGGELLAYINASRAR